jgi:hypothetical protein
LFALRTCVAWQSSTQPTEASFPPAFRSDAVSFSTEAREGQTRPDGALERFHHE